MRPDKTKVVDEIWDDERIDSFLSKQPMGDEPAEFSLLLNAYRSMRPADGLRGVRLVWIAVVNTRIGTSRRIREQTTPDADFESTPVR